MEIKMKRVFILKGLDCPNCSAKIEKEVGALPGVESSVVNLMQQTLTVQSEKSADATLAEQVETIVHSHEPDVEVSEKTEPAVTKVYLLKGLDCPNCSAKIEKEVGELGGVASSTVNLMNQTLTVQAGTSVATSLLDTVTTIVYSHEPDVEVSEKQLEATAPVKKDEKAAVYNDEDKKRTIRLAVGAVVYAIGMALTVFAKLPTLAELAFLIVAYVILGWDVVWQAVKNITRGQVFDEHFLMSVSTIGAFAIGEYPEAVAVMLFYQVGEFFQSLAVKRSRKSISDLMDIRPDSATVKRNGVLQVVSPESVAVGEIIVVKPGEKIPLDGIVVDGESMLDTKALTGESVPRSIRKGDEALSGCINQSGLLTLKVTKSFGESTVSKITDLVENASARKAPTENFITTFARYYTPVVVGMAAVLAIIPPLVLGGGWSEWLRRGFVFLIVSCPCALVISIPLTFFGGIGAASKRGVLVKGSNYLEALNKVSVVVFDKTGTLTKGVFEVANIIPAAGYQKEQVLEYAAQAESYSNHPIAKSILATYGKPIDQKQFSGFEEISGHGISVMVQGKKVLAGNSKLMESEKIAYAACDAAGTKFYVAADGSYVGCILIADEVKPDSKCAIAELKKIGVEKTVMQAIQMTIPNFRLSKIEDYLYTLDEMKLVNQIGNAYSLAGDNEKAADIFYRLLQYMRRHLQEMVTSNRMLPLVLYNFARSLDLLERYEESARVARNGKEACIKYGHYQVLHSCLEIEAECDFFLGKKEESAERYREAFYICKVMRYEDDLQIIRNEAQKYLDIIF